MPSRKSLRFRKLYPGIMQAQVHVRAYKFLTRDCGESVIAAVLSEDPPSGSLSTVCLSVSLFAIAPSVCQSASQSVCLSTVCLSVCLSFYRLSACQSVSLSTICLSVCLPSLCLYVEPASQSQFFVAKRKLRKHRHHKK